MRGEKVMHRMFSGFDYFYYGMSTFAVFLMIGIGVLVLGLYVLKSLALMQMAKDKGVNNPWLAWIPILDVYILGHILGQLDSHIHVNSQVVGGVDCGVHLKVAKPEIVLTVLYLIMLFGDIVPIIGSAIALLAGLLLLVALYELYRMFDNKNALLYTILSGVFMPLIPIFLFMNRNKFNNGPTIQA